MHMPWHWQYAAAFAPFRADIPTDRAPLFMRDAKVYVSAPLPKGQGRRYGFKTRSQRDKFVHAFKHLGAQNTRRK